MSTNKKTKKSDIIENLINKLKITNLEKQANKICNLIYNRIDNRTPITADQLISIYYLELKKDLDTAIYHYNCENFYCLTCTEERIKWFKFLKREKIDQSSWNNYEKDLFFYFRMTGYKELDDFWKIIDEKKFEKYIYKELTNQEIEIKDEKEKKYILQTILKNDKKVRYSETKIKEQEEEFLENNLKFLTEK